MPVNAREHRGLGIVRDFTDTLTSGTLIDDSGEAFMHGANVGLEARW
jgi:hypothetical protein